MPAGAFWKQSRIFVFFAKVIFSSADKHNKEWNNGHDGHSNTGRRDP